MIARNDKSPVYKLTQLENILQELYPFADDVKHHFDKIQKFLSAVSQLESGSPSDWQQPVALQALNMLAMAQKAVQLMKRNHRYDMVDEMLSHCVAQCDRGEKLELLESKLHDQADTGLFSFAKAGLKHLGRASQTVSAGSSTQKYRTYALADDTSIAPQKLQTELRIDDQPWGTRVLSAHYVVSAILEARKELTERLALFKADLKQAEERISVTMKTDPRFLAEKVVLHNAIREQHQKLYAKQRRISQKNGAEESKESKEIEEFFAEEDAAEKIISQLQRQFTKTAKTISAPLIQTELQLMHQKWDNEIAISWKMLRKITNYPQHIIDQLRSLNPFHSKIMPELNELKKSLEERLKDKKHSKEHPQIVEELMQVESTIAQLTAVTEHNAKVSVIKNDSEQKDEKQADFWQQKPLTLTAVDADALVIQRLAADGLNPVIAQFMFLLHLAGNLPLSVTQIIIQYIHNFLMYDGFMQASVQNPSFNIVTTVGTVIPTFVDNEARDAFCRGILTNKPVEAKTCFVLPNEWQYGFLLTNETDKTYSATTRVMNKDIGAFLSWPYELPIFYSTAYESVKQRKANTNLKLAHPKKPSFISSLFSKSAPANLNKVEITFQAKRDAIRHAWPMVEVSSDPFKFIDLEKNATKTTYKLPSLKSDNSYSSYDTTMIDQQMDDIIMLLCQALNEHPNYSAAQMLEHLGEKTKWCEEITKLRTMVVNIGEAEESPRLRMG